MAEQRIKCPKCGTEDYPSNLVCWQCSSQLILQASNNIPDAIHTPPPTSTGQPAFADEVQTISESLVRPLGISLIVGVACLVAVFAIMGGIMALLLADWVAGSLAGLVKWFALAKIAVWGGVFYMACKLWYGRDWARIGFILLSGLGIICNLARLLIYPFAKADALSGVSSHQGPMLYVLYLLLATAFLIVLNNRETNAFCSN